VTGAVGVSNWTAAHVREAPGLAALQMRATYLTAVPDADYGLQLPVDTGHLELAAERGMVVFGYSALLSGGYTPGRALDERYDHAGTPAQLTAVADVAAEAGATANQVVLAWLVASGVTPVLGVSRVEQLDEALEARDLVLSDGARARLDEARGGPLGVG
jgi:aryl-alcohol dehydrogenase-like predicted oxidoreductase